MWKTMTSPETEVSPPKATSVMTNLKSKNGEGQHPKVEDGVPSTSSDVLSAANELDFRDVTSNFQQAFARYADLLTSANDTHKILHVENRELEAEIQKVRKEKERAEQETTKVREEMKQEIEILTEQLGEAKKSCEKYLEKAHENEDLKAELQDMKYERDLTDRAARTTSHECKKAFRDVKDLTAKLEEARRHHEEHVRRAQKNEGLKAELQELKEDKAATEELFCKGLAILEGVIGGFRKQVEEAIAKPTQAGIVECITKGRDLQVEILKLKEEREPVEIQEGIEKQKNVVGGVCSSENQGLQSEIPKLRGNVEPVGREENFAKPTEAVDGIKARARQDLQSEIQQLKAKKNAAETVAAHIITRNEVLERKWTTLSEDLEKEKSNRILHVKKVREALDANHKKELYALKTKHEKEIESIKKGADESRNLRKENERLKVENKSLKKKVVGAEQAMEEAKVLKDRLEGLQTECNGLRQDLEEAEDRPVIDPQPCNNLEKEIRNIHRQVRESRLEELEKTKEQLAGALSARDAFREQCDKLEKELADLKMNFANDHLAKSLLGEITNLQAQIAELERDRDTKAPLVEKGAAIRMRFLAQAENTIMNNLRDNPDTEVVAKGNAAAHQGDGMADAALFRGGYVFESSYGGRFKTVYTLNVAKYLALGTMAKKAIDLWVTVRISIQSGDRSAAPRKEFSRLIGELGAFVKVLEESDEAAALLQQLEAVTDEIVQLDLGRGSRRAGHFVS
jgi:hypothetical protein